MDHTFCSVTIFVNFFIDMFVREELNVLGHGFRAQGSKSSLSLAQIGEVKILSNAKMTC